MEAYRDPSSHAIQTVSILSRPLLYTSFSELESQPANMSSSTTDSTEKESLKDRIKDHNLFPELRSQMKGVLEDPPH